jgi:hypothetical protein
MMLMQTSPFWCLIQVLLPGSLLAETVSHVFVTHKRGTPDPACAHIPVHGWHFVCLVPLWLLYRLTVIKAVCRMLTTALPAQAQVVLEPAAMGSARVLQVRPFICYHFLAPCVFGRFCGRCL